MNESGIECNQNVGNCIERVFSSENAGLRPLCYFRTFPQQLKYYKEHFTFVVSNCCASYHYCLCRNQNKLLLKADKSFKLLVDDQRLK